MSSSGCRFSSTNDLNIKPLPRLAYLYSFGCSAENAVIPALFCVLERWDRYGIMIFLLFPSSRFLCQDCWVVWCLPLHGKALFYLTVSKPHWFIFQNNHRHIVYQDISIETKPFVWRSLQEHNELNDSITCRNSVQGRDLLVDDRGM